MFRRTKSDTSADAAGGATAADPTGGKGRPTRTRREAEAQLRARAKPPTDRREAARLMRQRRAEQSGKMRQAMRTGDERYLPARDKGPVRRFTRDLVDSRICVGEFLLPGLVVVLLLNGASPQFSSSASLALFLIEAVDTVWVVVKLRRELRRRFPAEVSQGATKGTTLYAVMRAIQMRFLRLPKPQVKIGQKLPDRY